MHELSLAHSIAEIAATTCGEQAFAGSGRVRSIRVRVGDLSGVDAEALTFSFEVVRGGWPATEQAVLAIERIPARVCCRVCHQITDLEERQDACPQCGAERFDLINGRELEVFGVEVEERASDLSG